MFGLQRNWFSGDKLAESFEKIKTRADQDRMINAYEIICHLGICVGAAFAESMVELDDFKGLVGAENWTQRTSPSSQLSQPTKSTRTTSLCVSKNIDVNSVQMLIDVIK